MSQAPVLLVELPAWHRAFCENLAEFLLRGSPRPGKAYRQAGFWSDVFVSTGAPWRRLFQSYLYHAFVITAIWGLSVTWLNQPRLRTRSPFENSKLTYYSVSEYLPEIDTGSAPAKEERKGEPAPAKQPIISMPKLPDNPTQTIITSNSVRLPQEVRMPNLVAWTPVPAPVPAAALSRSQLTLPSTPISIIAPPPESRRNVAQVRLPMSNPEVVAPPPELNTASSQIKVPNMPAPAVIEPPVSAEATRRKPGELNVAGYKAEVAAPRLPVAEQQTAAVPPSQPGASGEGNSSAPPPTPAVTGIGSGKEAVGQLIALGLNPAPVNGAIAVPSGSRHGEFAATPEGKAGASGTPDIKGGGSGAGGSGNGDSGPGRGGNGVPSGIYVGPGAGRPPAGVVVAGDPSGKPASNMSGATTVVASVNPPRVTDPSRTTRPTSLDAPSKIEDKVFAGKRYYSTIINMPNLASSGGSWIIRFAELNETRERGDVLAPVATLKVDPKYPPELMREGVEGTVTLYAVIRKDGSVGEIRLLRGLEQRLDNNAQLALSHWHFRPGTKNGAAVDLEAVVSIPFRAGKLPF